MCYPPPPGTIAPTKPRRRSNRASDETAETLTPHLLCSRLALMGFHRSGANTIRHQLPLAPVIRYT